MMSHIRQWMLLLLHALKHLKPCSYNASLIGGQPLFTKITQTEVTVWTTSNRSQFKVQLACLPLLSRDQRKSSDQDINVHDVTNPITSGCGPRIMDPEEIKCAATFLSQIGKWHIISYFMTNAALSHIYIYIYIYSLNRSFSWNITSIISEWVYSYALTLWYHR